MIDRNRFMNFIKAFLLITFVLASTLIKPVYAQSPNEIVQDATLVLKELMMAPDRRIPQRLLDRCYGIAIFPSLYQAGFLVGIGYGRGILVARNFKTGRWHGPIFLKLATGSFGWQIGIKATDLVLVIMNPRGVESFLKDNFTLGADLSAAAGPVGRSLSASTDVTLNAAIYSYSRSKGFFAGAYIQGAALGQDYEADRIFYGHPINPREVILGKQPNLPDVGKQLLLFLNTHIGKINAIGLH